MSLPTEVRTVDHVVRGTVAMALAGAALIHIDAAGDHTAHLHLAAFFVALGIVQLALAALLAFRPNRTIVAAAAATTAGAMVIWAVSRTTGIPLVPDANHVEAVGVKDAMAVLLEAAALVGFGVLAILPAAALGALVVRAERAMATAAAIVLVAAIPGVAAAHHDHGEPAHAHGDQAHGTTGAASTRHQHAAGAEHAAAHGPEDAGHEHGQGTSSLMGRPIDHHLVGANHTGDVLAAHAHEVAAPTAPHHAPGDGHAADHGGPGHSPPTASAKTAPSFQPEPHGVLASVRYGPFTLPPASTDDVRSRNAVLTNVVLTNLPKPCENCYLTYFEPNLVYPDGKVANYDTGAMLHHNVLAQSQYDDVTCNRFSAIGFAGKRFFASGNERTAASTPKGYGVFLDSSPVTGIFEIMNHKDTEQTVYFQLVVRYVTDATKVKPITPVWLDVDNCSDSEFDVPAGRSVTTWDWKSTLTGRIVLAAGHVHDGGVAIELVNATSGESMCNSVAGYGNKPAYLGTIDTMSVCSWDRIGVVRKGETLRLNTLYDTKKPLTHVMGIVMAFVYETNDLQGGTAAPRSMTHPETSNDPPPESGAHSH